MDPQPHSDEPEASASANFASEDQLLCAYGRKVKELFSQSDAETWIEDLWDMYTAPGRQVLHFSAIKPGVIR